MTAKHAMAIGTAGYTAMLCVMALEKHGLTPELGEILVTGANGGVGSYAVALLSKLGYKVVASTGRVDESAYLKKLGASEIIDRNTLSEPGRPLAKERWAGVVDSVGSHTLVNACAATKSEGVVTACGLAQGMDLPGTVAPFILRGVTLVGINSVYRSLEDRVEAWKRLGEILDAEIFEDISKEIGLTDVISTSEDLIAGKVQGRVIVNLV
jgi:acrylyl-CoA reductase (NADPH)